MLENNNTLSTSNIFQYIFQIWESLGMDVTVEELFNNENPFLSHAYLYNGYRIEVHCGQGCYYRIYKNNECLFQSY